MKLKWTAAGNALAARLPANTTVSNNNSFFIFVLLEVSVALAVKSQVWQGIQQGGSIMRRNNTFVKMKIVKQLIDVASKKLGPLDKMSI
ncbi:MAG TPA: hypothetical protein VEU94_05805 [Terriglobales bacterium]|nr:hypothetical protein [Terriglobales bacterium]